MHLNYHFLKYLCPALNDQFQGQKIISCFSQSKNELIIETTGSEGEQWMRAHLKAPQIYLSFPEQFRRTKRNSMNLFPELLEETIQSCEVLAFERSFIFRLQSGKILLFKLHGNRSNILLYESEGQVPIRTFRNDLGEDRSLDWHELPRSLDLSKKRFLELDGNASQFLPTLGAVPRAWLKDRGYPNAKLEMKWSLMEEMVDILDSPLFSLVEKAQGTILTLLPEPEALKNFSDPILAVNELFYLALVKDNFEREKSELLKKLNAQLSKTQSFLKKGNTKLQELKTSAPPSQLADVVMANLHEFAGGKMEAEILDFYSGGKVKVKLKPNQKPQDFAAQLYRKSKNRKLEWDQLEKTLQAKQSLLEDLQSQIVKLEKITDFRGLKGFKKEEVSEKTLLKESSSLPFKIFEIEGFTVWVGKSAKDNDEMLRGFVHKDDLWLHSRLVPGSHVVIKLKGQKNLPQAVLDRAAALAAYYSKYKTESLAPVIYTEAKYVRKVKGSPAGSVKVDRETVLMVQPKGPDEMISSKNP
ncbi:NFACT RNA binding domain-containing protein [Algoriphagus machipongonensis]|uniref:RNA-binding protein n=1 Tax=Algoriphagus machipongonensis TaxID=388413 RepID=A3I0G8_9BACT|nr:NFACT RNA binding domain-containing protein [Algoriphagus machipongonensis]EAZ79964.1 putative RNA-binding protein [Algoriphagus machipongonensis]